jgi:hypothetical protein
MHLSPLPQPQEEAEGPRQRREGNPMLLEGDPLWDRKRSASMNLDGEASYD